jgi:tetrathionate reductase subunit B
MVTDLRKCVGCQACTVACNAEWDVPSGHARTHVSATPIAGTFPHLHSGFYVAQCNHCDRPSCTDACPSGATFRRADGIVVVDTNLCIGCGFCAEACPYDARFVNPATKRVDKCDFCAPRLARGQQPACVTTCTAHAKFFGDLEDPASDVSRMVFREGAERVDTEEVAIGPNVFYLAASRHLDQVRASFPPREPRLPASGRAWAQVVKPLVLTAVAATFLGQAVAFFTQLRHGESDFDD